MHYSYECELKFMISHFNDDNGVVTAWDYTSFKRDLYAGFKASGLNYFIAVPIKEVIEGYEYDAELIIVYCSEMLEQVFIKEFQDICCKYHKELGISTFYYTQNGVLVSLEIGGDSL